MNDKYDYITELVSVVTAKVYAVTLQSTIDDTQGYVSIYQVK